MSYESEVFLSSCMAQVQTDDYYLEGLYGSRNQRLIADCLFLQF